MVKPEAFRLISGEEALQEYQPDQNHHVFCRHCGVRPFAWGENPAMGGKYYVIKVNCLDDVSWEELADALVTYFDGRNDKYNSAPAETRHL